MGTTLVLAVSQVVVRFRLQLFYFRSREVALDISIAFHCFELVAVVNDLLQYSFRIEGQRFAFVYILLELNHNLV